jgi:poly-gamma-glutamate capsule biosynthesis protein CapA/YwtB (metallophosphatase superfamily)
MSTVRIIIGGDTYFGEFYQSRREQAGKTNYLRSRGYTYFLEQLLPFLKSADCVVVNLECALTKQRRSELEGKKSWILAGDPTRTIAALREANVSAAMLGNNHAKDYGSSALLETIEHLEVGGVTPIGAGMNCAEAQKPLTYQCDLGNGTFKLAIISAYRVNQLHQDLGFYAKMDRSGVNGLDTRALGEQISELKRSGYFVVISPHWGQNYFLRNYSQATLATRLILGGADLIAGHGPHMLNEFCQEQGVWVVYSLGNLVFNSEGEYAARQVLPYSLIMELVAESHGQGYEMTMNLYPTVSCNQMTEFQPRFVRESEFDQVTAALRGLHYDPRVFDESVQRRRLGDRFCFSMRVAKARPSER